MTDPVSLLIITAAFLLGGFVKGAAGMGMPAITVSLLAFVFDLPAAMALMLVPGLVSNAVQAVAGPDIKGMLKRIAPFLIPSLLTIWFGTGLLIRVENNTLIIMLGVILMIYSAVGLAGFSLTLSPTRERWIAPIFGAVNGIFTGLTGVTSTPSIIFLNGLGLRRDYLIQAMGLLFLISYIVLSISLILRGLVSFNLGGLSFFAVIPALAGLKLGAMVRKRLSEKAFKRLLYWVLLGLGLYLVVRGWGRIET